MARLRNINSGAIVNVPDEKAERLGAEWEPAEAVTAPAEAESTSDSESETDAVEQEKPKPSRSSK